MEKNENRTEIKEQNNEQGIKTKKKFGVIQILIIIFTIALIVSIGYNINIYYEILMRKNYDKYIKELEIVKNESGLSALSKRNNDIVAWLTIQDQNISFPIVKTETEKEENFYLNHDFRKRKNDLGCPYQKHDTNIFETDNATFIGHSSFNIGFFGKTYEQSIFASLNNYLYTSSGYNYEIKVETLNGTYVYKIFATIKFNVNNEHTTESDIYSTVNFNSNADFDTYYSNVTNLSRIDNGITASYGDKLLTLFTCNYNLDYRTMVIAKRITI